MENKIKTKGVQASGCICAQPLGTAGNKCNFVCHKKSKIYRVRNIQNQVLNHYQFIICVQKHRKKLIEFVPNDIIYVKPLKQKSLGTGETLVQSITTIAAVLSLVTTTILLLRL